MLLCGHRRVPQRKREIHSSYFKGTCLLLIEGEGNKACTILGANYTIN